MAKLPGNTTLNLCGDPGGTALDLGYDPCAVTGPSVTVGAVTRPPRAAVVLVDVKVTTVAARTRTPTLTARVVPVPKVSVGATTRKPRLNADLAYDPNLLSDVVALATETWRSGDRVPHSAAEAWQERLPSFGAGIGAWSPAQALSGPAVPSWNDSERMPGAGVEHWRAAGAVRGGTVNAWKQAPREDAQGSERWCDGWRELVGEGDIWVDLPPLREGYRERWREAGRELYGFATCHTDGAKLADALRQCWRDATLVPYWLRPEPPPPPPPPWVRTWGNNLCLVQPLGSPLDLGFYGCAPQPPQESDRIPIRRVYIVIHDISLTRLSDGVEIPCRSLSIALDADSWAWTWSGDLIGPYALDAVRPVNDEPVTLVAEINGYTWHLLAEEWTEDREFARRGIKVSGRGLSAWLAAPYELPASGILANARTIQQAMGELLPFDWTLTWELGAPDWMLPAGSWSRTNLTTIQAIHAAAQESGLIVVPAMADRALHVQRRYPVLPWEYATATPDLVVPDAAILQLSKRRQAEAQANAVYVHGGEVGGILARVYRTGSAGDRLAPTQSSALVTHADAARTLGGRILAAHDAQPELRSVTLPLGGDFLLGAVGELLRVEEGATVHLGIVNGVTVQVQAGDKTTVRQTLTVGEDTPNQWARFRRLVPGDPLLAGEIAIDYCDGTVKVDLIGGGSVRVRGSGSGNVYVRAGQVVGEAPSLSAVEIDI